MAYEWGPKLSESYEAGVDLSAKQFRAVVLDTNRLVQLVTTAGLGDAILQNAPVAGDTAEFTTSGVVKVLCGGNVAVGDEITTDNTGAIVKYTPVTDKAKKVIGTAREAGSSGAIIAAAINFNGVVPVSDT